MAIFNRNIWLVYYILICAGFVFMSIMSYNTWKIEISSNIDRQKHLVSLVSGALHGQLVSQEMVLDILNEELVKEYRENSNKHNDIAVPALFDRLLAHNPAIAGIAMIGVDGNFIHASGNVISGSLPNLKKQPESRESFIHTIKNSDKMVLGRTYFFPPLNKWIIPIRKAVKDNNGKIIGVTSSGFTLDHSFDIFSSDLHLDNSNEIVVIRELDKYLQYISTNSPNVAHRYEKNETKEYRKANRAVLAKYGKSLEDIKKTKDIYTINMKIETGQEFQVLIRYDERYELWTVSSMEIGAINNKSLRKILLYVYIFLVVYLVLYLLFKYIADAEKKRRESLKYQANHDSLTRLPNRNFFNENINKWIHPEAPPFALFYIDMDNFKNINDSFGHRTGDMVLQHLANRLRTFKSDDSIIMRQGGDEFLVILHEDDNIKLMDIASKLIDILTAPYTINSLRFVIGASIGISKFPEHGVDFDTLLSSADIAMYEAKKNRNKALIFYDSMKATHLYKINMEQELRKAIYLNELFMVFQPQVDSSGKVYGMESLVRWNSASLGNVPPSDFIPVAESTGLILEIGDYIIDNSLKNLRFIQDTTGKHYLLSINISVSQLMELGFSQSLISKINKYDLDKSMIKLEITESLFIEDLELLRPVLNELNDNGIRISLDDFGTGYSSLSMLRHLPIDELKIDKSFVDDITSDESSLIMIQNIIDIGVNLKMSVIAEGVETNDQKNLLNEFGCNKFQGYLFAKPMTIEEIIDFLVN